MLRLAARWADPLRRAMRQLIDADQAVDDFLQDFPPGTELTPDQARDWALARLRVNTEALDAVLTEMYAVSWLLGQDMASFMLDNRGKLRKADEPALIDWSKWKPGNRLAQALLRRPGGLQRLLADRNIVIRSIAHTSLDRLGTLLAAALGAGKNPADIKRDVARLMKDPSRALMVAQTEMARGQSMAAFEQFREAGVATVEWSAIDDGTCDICPGNEEFGPVPLGSPFPSGDTEPPAHPNCRCALIPGPVDFDNEASLEAAIQAAMRPQ